MPTTVRQALGMIDRDQRARWILLTLFAVVASGFEMLGALLVYVLLGLVLEPRGQIDLPIIGDVRALAGDIDEAALLLGLLLLIGAFFLLRAVLHVGVTYAQQRVAHNAGARLSNRLVQGYLSWPYAAHLQRNSAELIRNGHEAVQHLVNQVYVPIIRVTAHAILTLGMLVVLAVIAPAATALVILIVGGAAGLLLLVVQPRLRRLGHTAHRMAVATLSSLQQSLQGLRDLKVLGRERYFARRYAQSRLALARAHYLRATAIELPRIVIETALISFIIVFFAFTFLGGSPPQEVLSLLGLFAYVGLRLQPSLQAIIGGLNNIKYSSAPLEDLHADLQAVSELPPAPEDIEPLPFESALILEGISFHYEGTDRPALSGLDLTIRPGEVIGICGPTGGGKTTLSDILAGLLAPTTGRITVDGQDLQLNVRPWQRNIGIVPQSVFLIDDTLRRNIALGMPDGEIDDQAVLESIELAQLRAFISSLPRGLDTVVGERGVRVSGGQRQRIAIARALYRHPAVLIFDEGTSALDNATEAQLIASIEKLRGDHTIILVAHRLSTVRRSDRIVFVEQGQITGDASYDVLSRSHVAFRAMAGTT